MNIYNDFETLDPKDWEQSKALMHKMVDDAFDFDEIAYKFFNDDGTISGSGGPDVETRSTRFNEYIEHEYTAGVTDDGIGVPLDEFISFQIKIVLRATNQARPPRIKKLRAIALAT